MTIEEEMPVNLELARSYREGTSMTEYKGISKEEAFNRLVEAGVSVSDADAMIDRAVQSGAYPGSDILVIQTFTVRITKGERREA